MRELSPNDDFTITYMSNTIILFNYQYIQGVGKLFQEMRDSAVFKLASLHSTKNTRCRIIRKIKLLSS